WSIKFSAELAAKGFEQCQADQCVFGRVLRGKVVVIIVVYVDDLLVANETKRDEEQAINDLRSCFPIKKIGEAGFYLGCHIPQDRDAGTLNFDQHHYVRTMASKFSVDKTSTTPAVAGAKPLSKDDAPQTGAETEEMRGTPYREAVGALMWAATMTRPDVTYAAHQLGKFNDKPGPAHWRAAERALQYLWRTKDVGVTYGGTPGSFTKLSAWADADFATCPDTRRSVSGGAVMLREGAISLFSRMQKVTAAVSSESEYVALAEVVNGLRFLRQEKGFLTPPIDDNIIIREDNEGAIKMGTNRFSSRCTRHVDVKRHIVRDAVENGIVRIHYVKSGEQYADVRTRSL
ncbi:unnamed protein product, partial [Ascophyllum nodosum]